MSDVRPLAESQGISASDAQHCCDAGEPDHLIEDGLVSLSAGDSRRRDHRARACSADREGEERVQRAIARSYDDMLHGRTHPWSQAKLDAVRIRVERYGA